MTDEHPCCPDAHKMETPTLFGTSLPLLLASVISVNSLSETAALSPPEL